MVWKHNSFDHFSLWDGDNEAASPLTDVRQLFKDFISQVPGQNQHVVWPGSPDHIRVVNWDVRAWKKQGLLVRADIHSVIHEILPNSAVIEERVALRWSSIGDDGFAGSVYAYQECEEGAFRFTDPFAEAGIGVQVANASCKFPLFQLGNTRMRHPRVFITADI